MQSGAVLGPGDQASQPGGPEQVGGQHPRRRGEGHGRSGAHVVRFGLRSVRESAELREAGRRRGREHEEHPEERRRVGEESQRVVQRAVGDGR